MATENNEKCEDTGVKCTGSVPSTLLASCPAGDNTSWCYVPISVTGPIDNFTCADSEGSNCTTDTPKACVTYDEGTCMDVITPLGTEMEECDTQNNNNNNPMSNGTATACQ